MKTHDVTCMCDTLKWRNAFASVDTFKSMNTNGDAQIRQTRLVHPNNYHENHSRKEFYLEFKFCFVAKIYLIIFPEGAIASNITTLFIDLLYSYSSRQFASIIMTNTNRRVWIMESYEDSYKIL